MHGIAASSTYAPEDTPRASGWTEVTRKDLEAARRRGLRIVVDDVELGLEPFRPKAFGPNQEFEVPRTTLWSFPDRGSWATHRGNYRGNWSPYIPRTLILKYTEPGQLVLDPMCGSGTTLVESRLLGRNAVGADINPDAALLSRARLDFDIPSEHLPWGEGSARTFRGDATNLGVFSDGSVDLVATHPPYAHIIKYTRGEVDGDLSRMAFPLFLEAIEQVAKEAFRVLRPGKHCAVLAGDTRKHRHYVPVSLGILSSFLKAGFVLKEDIIKAQHNMKTTREGWGGRYDFYLLAHEHLFIFRKPLDAERAGLRWSTRWW